MSGRYLISLNDAEESEEGNVNVHVRRIRDVINPFHISDDEFVLMYRLPKEGAMALIEAISPHLRRPRRSPIPDHMRILCTLHFLASGSYQRRVGQEYLHCLCRTEVTKSILAVTHVITHALLPAWIKFPMNDRQKQSIKARFMEQTEFPGIVGVVDGTHIAIEPPNAERERIYLNREHFHSKNVLVVCDYDLKILALNARHGGRSHDSHIWRTSTLKDYMRQTHQLGDTSSWLIGDSYYPQEPWLMTPILNPGEGSPESQYNARHTAARECIKRCIGVWKGWFRCLRLDRTLHYPPEKAGRIINSCAVLHNMALYYRVPHPPLAIEEDVYQVGVVEMVPADDGDLRRRELVAEHFA